MANLKVADFYYGAVLSMLFNKGISPMLIEGGKDRQIYDFTTNDVEFRLFIKYRSFGRYGSNNYRSWSFVFSDSDVIELNQYITEGRNISLGLVCGNKGLNDSEYAVLHTNEISDLLLSGKRSITLSRRKRERAFRVSIGGSRDNAMIIHANRLY